MAYISEALRRQVIERARGLCEYCQTQQAIVIEMEIDHVVPESAGGLTEIDNLSLACGHCNSHKHYFQAAADPKTGETVPLFNPRTQIWGDHFPWSEDSTLIIGLSPIGRATVERLKVNRDLVVQARERWVEAGWHPPRID
jgi:hypothetical protein